MTDDILEEAKKGYDTYRTVFQIVGVASKREW